MTLIDTEPAIGPDAGSEVLYRLAGVTRTYQQKGRIVRSGSEVDSIPRTVD